MLNFFKNNNADKIPEAYEHVMSRANELHALKNVAGLFDLIKIITFPIKAKHISEVYFKEDHGGLQMIRFFFDIGLSHIPDGKNPNEFGYSMWNDCQVDTDKHVKTIHLASDIVLPTSWHPSSIVNMLGQIGTGEKYMCGKFEQSINHKVLYTYPLDITWVNGGNHSITQGILRGEGVLNPEEILDLTPLMKLVRFDGIDWRGIKCNEKLGTPRYIEFGWRGRLAGLLLSFSLVPMYEIDSLSSCIGETQLLY